MKGVIFTEGKNDNHFVGEVFNKSLPYDIYEREFNAEDISPDEVKPAEASIIRRFTQSTHEEAILLKSEQGKPQLIEVAGLYLPQLANEGVFQSVVIDLDQEDTHEEVIHSIESGIDGRLSESVVLESVGTKIENSYFIGNRIEILLNSEVIDTTGFISFKDNIESAAGIDDEAHSDTARERISEFIDMNPDIADDAISTLI